MSCGSRRRRFRTSIPVNNAASGSTVIIGTMGQPKLPTQPLDLVGKPVAIPIVADEVGEVLNPSQSMYLDQRPSLDATHAALFEEGVRIELGVIPKGASSAQINKPRFPGETRLSEYAKSNRVPIRKRETARQGLGRAAGAIGPRPGFLPENAPTAISGRSRGLRATDGCPGWQFARFGLWGNLNASSAKFHGSPCSLSWAAT